MKKWNLIVDVAKCTNCNLCTLANQDEHVGNEFEGYSAPMPRTVIAGSIFAAKSAARVPSWTSPICP